MVSTIFKPLIYIININRAKKNDAEYVINCPCDYINFRLNRHNASIIIQALAYTKRQLYYGSVENVNVFDYFDKENLISNFNDCNFAMKILHGKCQASFGTNYQEYKINY